MTTAITTHTYDLKIPVPQELTIGSVEELIDRVTDVACDAAVIDGVLTAEMPLGLSDDPFTAGIEFAARVDELDTEMRTFGITNIAACITPRASAPWPVSDVL